MPKVKKGDSLKEGLKSRYKYGSIVFEVLEMHRTTNHFSLWKDAEGICEVLESIPEGAVKKAFEVYQNYQGDKKPHPNYFIAVAKNNASKFQTQSEFEVKPSWGKTI